MIVCSVLQGAIAKLNNGFKSMVADKFKISEQKI